MFISATDEGRCKGLSFALCDVGGVDDFFTDPVKVMLVDGFCFFFSELFVGFGVGEVVEMNSLYIFL